MANLSEIVDSLENRISKLLRGYEETKQKNLNLEEELKILKSQQNQFQQENQDRTGFARCQRNQPLYNQQHGFSRQRYCKTKTF